MNKRLQTHVIVRNNSKVNGEVEIKRNIRVKFMIDILKITNFGGMTERKWKINGMEKIE